MVLDPVPKTPKRVSGGGQFPNRTILFAGVLMLEKKRFPTSRPKKGSGPALAGGAKEGGGVPTIRAFREHKEGGDSPRLARLVGESKGGTGVGPKGPARRSALSFG